ncbi:hypothetical protein V6N13_065417 [Hibiscus sabdariffa]
MCRPVGAGGLGFRNLSMHIDAFLMKLWKDLGVIWDDVRNNVVWHNGHGQDVWILDIGPLMNYVAVDRVQYIIEDSSRHLLGNWESGVGCVDEYHESILERSKRLVTIFKAALTSTNFGPTVDSVAWLRQV